MAFGNRHNRTFAYLGIGRCLKLALSLLDSFCGLGDCSVGHPCWNSQDMADIEPQHITIHGCTSHRLFLCRGPITPPHSPPGQGSLEMTPQWTLRRGGLGTVENAAFLPPPLGGAMMETWSFSLRSYTNPHTLTNFGMSVKPLGFSWIPLCYLVSDGEEAPFTSTTGWGGTGGSHTDKLSKDPEKASSQNSSWLPP